MFKRKSILFLLLILLGTGAGLYLMQGDRSLERVKTYFLEARDSVTDLIKGKEKPKKEQPQSKSEPRPQPVSVLTLSAQSIQITESLPGRVVAYRQSQVRPQVEGVIKNRLFEEGEVVRKGQQLYQIDDARYKAALSSARADLEGVRANVKMLKAKAGRYEKLARTDVISQQQYEEIQAQYELELANIGVAQAAVDTAQINLDYTKVYAPISGQISRSFVTEGALVTANQEDPLAIITQLDPVYVDMQLSGGKTLRLHSKIKKLRSVPVHLRLDDKGSRYTHTGGFKFSEVTIDETADSITLRALFPNPDGVLLPGLFVRAVLDMGERKGALLVPQRAAIRKPDGTLQVWVVGKDDTVQPRPIKIDSAHKGNWIVADGLREGETIVVEGYDKIRPGSQVAASPWKQGETSSGVESVAERRRK